MERKRRAVLIVGRFVRLLMSQRTIRTANERWRSGVGGTYRPIRPRHFTVEQLSESLAQTYLAKIDIYGVRRKIDASHRILSQVAPAVPEGVFVATVLNFSSPT